MNNENDPIPPQAPAEQGAPTTSPQPSPTFGQPEQQPAVQPPVTTYVAPVPTPAPVADPVATDQMTVVPTPPPKKKRVGLIIAIIAAILVVLLTASAALAYNFWYQKPEKVVMDAVTHAVKAHSSTLTGTATIKTKDTTVDITIDGKSKSLVTGQYTAKATFAYEGKKYTINGSVLTDEDGMPYVKFDGLRTFLESALKEGGSSIDLLQYDTLLDMIDGKWIRISYDDFGADGKEMADMQTCVTNALKSLNSDDAMRQEIVSLYDKHRFITIDGELGSRSIDGVGSLGYKMKTDKQAAQDFYVGLGSTKLGSALKACSDKITFNASDIESSTSSDSKLTTTAEVWVSRFGHEFTELNGTTKDGDDESTFVIHPTFNQGVSVEKPQNYTTLKAVMEEYTKVMLTQFQSYYSDDSFFDSSFDKS